MFAGWQPAVGEIPDVYIEPQNSKIIEVKGYQINETVKFKSGLTLRFPRVRRIREDKDWFECLDTKGFNEIARNTKKRKLADMNVEDIKSDKSSKTKERGNAEKKKKREVSAVDHCKDTDTTNVAVESGLFKGSEFSMLTNEYCLSVTNFIAMQLYSTLMQVFQKKNLKL